MKTGTIDRLKTLHINQHACFCLTYCKGAVSEGRGTLNVSSRSAVCYLHTSYCYSVTPEQIINNLAQSVRARGSEDVQPKGVLWSHSLWKSKAKFRRGKANEGTLTSLDMTFKTSAVPVTHSYRREGEKQC